MAGKPFTYCHAFSRCCRNAVSAQKPSASATKHPLKESRNHGGRPRRPPHAPGRPRPRNRKGPIYSLAGLLLFFFSGCLLDTSSRESIESARPAPFGDSDMMQSVPTGDFLSSLIGPEVGGSLSPVQTAAFYVASPFCPMGGCSGIVLSGDGGAILVTASVPPACLRLTRGRCNPAPRATDQLRGAGA